MSTENDVPLGEGSRQYYEQKFGERIRQVSKGGSRPSANNYSDRTKGSSAGCGVIFLVFIILRIIASLSRSSSHTPTYQYTPPPPVIQKQPWKEERKQFIPKQPDKPFGREQPPFNKQ